MPFVQVVGCATSGRAALTQTEGLQPDLVLMDIVMPGLSGLEATRRLKDRPNAPRVVLLSWHNSRDYQRAGSAAGADGFLTKSEFCEQVAAIVHRLFPESFCLETNQVRSP